MKKVKLYITLLSAVWLAASTIALGQNKAEVFLDLDHGWRPSEISVSSNARYVLTRDGKEFKVWNTKTEKLIKSLTIQDINKQTYIYDSTVMPDGKVMAFAYDLSVNSAGEERTRSFKVHLLDLETGEYIGPALEHQTYSRDYLKGLISPDGTKMVLFYAGRINIYETTTANKLQSIAFNGVPHQIVFARDGSQVYITTKKKTGIQLFSLDTRSWQLHPVYSDKISSASELLISADGMRAMAIMGERDIENFDLQSGRTINSYRIRRRDVKHMKFLRMVLSRDGKLAVLEYANLMEPNASRSKSIIKRRYGILNNETGDVYGFFSHFQLDKAGDIRISPDNQKVFLENAGAMSDIVLNLQKKDLIKDWKIRMFTKDFTIPEELKEGSGQFRYNAFLDADRAITFKDGRLVKISIQTGEVLSSFGDVIIKPDALVALDGGKKLLAGKHIWDLQTGQMVEPLTNPIFDSYVLLHNSKELGKIIIKTEKNSAQMLEFDIRTKSISAQYPMPADENMYYQFKYSKDGRYLMMAAKSILKKYQPYVRIWDTKTMAVIKDVPLDVRDFGAFDFSPDGRYFSISIISGIQPSEFKSELLLYDALRGVKKATIAQCTGNYNCVNYYKKQQFGPDGKYLLYGLGKTYKNTSSLWDLAASKTVRYFNNKEWRYNRLLDNNRLFLPDRIDGVLSHGKIIDINTGEVLTKNATESILSNVVPFKNGSYKKFSTGANGQIKITDIKTQKLLASSFLFSDGEWVTITPEGYYIASESGADHLNVRMGLHVYSMDNFFETYYRPDIVRAALQGQKPSQLADTDIREDSQLPPKVRFISKKSGYTSKEQKVVLETEITDQGGGIDEVRLYHNGKLIEGGTRGLKLVKSEGTLIRKFEVNLLPGNNRFKLTALSTGQRIESNPAKLNINYQGTTATSDLHVLAVGLNKYKNASMNLNYGRPDAEAFVSSLKKQSSGIFKSVNVTTLYDGNATRSGVKDAFEDIINKAKPQDAFLFFYAGHGVMSEPEGQKQGDFYMALHEATQLYGNNAGLKAHGISAAEMTDLTRRIAARKQMIVLDACQSGGAVETFAMRGAAEQKAIIQLARSAGLVVMASTGTQQYATEFDALGHGVFTYALLNGLQGQADGGSRDGKITVKELEAFINDRVPALTQKHRGQSQYPNSYARGQDFPIGVIK